MCSSVSTVGHTYADDADQAPYRSYGGEVRQWMRCSGCGNVTTRLADADTEPARRSLVGIDYTPTSAAETAIVDSRIFAAAFHLARCADERVAGATSPFDRDRDETDTIFRLTLDGESGYAVRADGELVYVFSLVPRRGDALVTSAIKRDGASRLDCFDGYLPSLYARHGFKVDSREPNWTDGEPDVVFMSL